MPLALLVAFFLNGLRGLRALAMPRMEMRGEGRREGVGTLVHRAICRWRRRAWMLRRGRRGGLGPGEGGEGD